jgi:ABC-type multidrug transport system ATPase subunit
MPNVFLKFNNLKKQFGYRRAVKSATGSVSENDYIALYGANGAGKTTLLYLLSGVYKPDTGHVEFPGRSKRQFYASMQLLSHQSMFYGRMSAEENLRFFQSLYKKTNMHDILFALEFTGLLPQRYNYTDGFSRGMIQRLMIARLLLTRPEFVFFDEPFTGLDIQGQKLLLSIIRHRGIPELQWNIRGFIFVDHDIQRAYELSDAIWFMQGGELQDPVLKRNLALNELTELLS